MLEKNDIESLLMFLSRTELKGSEAIMFVDTVTKLQNLYKEYEKQN